MISARMMTKRLQMNDKVVGTAFSNTTIGCSLNYAINDIEVTMQLCKQFLKLYLMESQFVECY